MSNAMVTAMISGGRGMVFVGIRKSDDGERAVEYGGRMFTPDEARGIAHEILAMADKQESAPESI